MLSSWSLNKVTCSTNSLTAPSRCHMDLAHKKCSEHPTLRKSSTKQMNTLKITLTEMKSQHYLEKDWKSRTPRRKQNSSADQIINIKQFSSKCSIRKVIQLKHILPSMAGLNKCQITCSDQAILSISLRSLSSSLRRVQTSLFSSCLPPLVWWTILCHTKFAWILNSAKYERMDSVIQDRLAMQQHPRSV